MKRYSIMVREIGSDHEVELCQCDGNPKAIAQIAASKLAGKKKHVYRYTSVRIIDRQQAA